MEQGFQFSRKRALPLKNASSEDVCVCQCHEGHACDASAQSWKRQRPEQDLTYVQQEDTFVGAATYGFTNGMPQAARGVNFPGDGLSTIPQLHGVTGPDPLTADGLCPPQQRVGWNMSTTDPSVTYAGTCGTLSPRVNDNQQPQDASDLLSVTLGGQSEKSFSGLDDFNLDARDGSSNGRYHGSFLSPHGSDWAVSPVEPMQLLDSNVASAIHGTSAVWPNSMASPAMPGVIDPLTGHSVEPWSYKPSFADGIINSLNDRLSKKNIWQHPVSPAAPKPQLPHLAPTKKGRPLSPKWNIDTPHSRLQPVAARGRKPGVRNQALSPEKRKNAKDIRGLGACWSCRLSKAPCSQGTPCDRCRKASLKAPSPSNGYHCYRTRLEDFERVFSPELVVQRFKNMAIDGLNFTLNEIHVTLSSGPTYPKIHLTATEFSPKDAEDVALDFVGADENCHTFTRSYAPPWALYKANRKILKDVCLKHVKGIIKLERDIGEATKGDTSMLSWEVFEAINRYRRENMKKSKKDDLLQNAALLHAMHYFMSRIIVLTKESADEAFRRLTSPNRLSFQRTLTSKMLQLQLKEAMQSLLSETMGDVLKGLERVLKAQRSNSTWFGTFCVVMIICICIESVQVATDSYAMAKLRRDPSSAISRSDLCQRLDEGPFAQVTDLFHKHYKSSRSVIDAKKDMVFNPLRDDCLANHGQNEKAGITQPMIALVDDIRGIMKRHKVDIEERSKIPNFNRHKDLLTDHMAFRKRNSGRLVSKFLMRFLVK